MEKLTLKSSIRDLELAVRDYSCLSKAGYDTIGDIVSSTYDKLLSIKNIKPDRLDAILDKICSFGFSIKGYNIPILTCRLFKAKETEIKFTTKGWKKIIA